MQGRGRSRYELFSGTFLCEEILRVLGLDWKYEWSYAGLETRKRMVEKKKKKTKSLLGVLRHTDQRKDEKQPLRIQQRVRTKPITTNTTLTSSTFFYFLFLLFIFGSSILRF